MHRKLIIPFDLRASQASCWTGSVEVVRVLYRIRPLVFIVQSSLLKRDRFLPKFLDFWFSFRYKAFNKSLDGCGRYIRSFLKKVHSA